MGEKLMGSLTGLPAGEVDADGLISLDGKHELNPS
jgi:hypothetical protein